MSKVFEKIAEEIITEDDFVSFIEEVNSRRLGEKFSEYLEEPEKDEDFFKKLKNYLEKIPRLKLEIAFNPSLEFLRRIKRRFEEENGRQVILDITINPGIVGGAIIEYEGRYRDFSLSEKMNLSVSQIKL